MFGFRGGFYGLDRLGRTLGRHWPRCRDLAVTASRLLRANHLGQSFNVAHLSGQEAEREVRSGGVPCCYSAEDLPPGAKWKDEISENLRAADRVLVIVSPNSLYSEGVRDEMGQVLGHAERSTLRLLPIRLLDDQPWKATDVPWVAAVRNSIHVLLTIKPKTISVDISNSWKH